MKRPAVLLAVLLFLASTLIISYRVISLGYPLFPAAPVKVWLLVMEGRLKSVKEEVTASIAFPYAHGRQSVVEERVTPGGLRFNLLREGPNQIGTWSGKTGPLGEIIGYRATVLVRPQKSSRARTVAAEPYPPSLGKEQQDLAVRLSRRWSQFPPRERAYAACEALSGKWGDPAPDGKDLEQWSALVARDGRMSASLALFAASNVPARAQSGLILEESLTTTPVRWIEVWTGNEWVALNPETGEEYDRSVPFLSLTTGDVSPIHVSTGELTELR